MTVGKGKYDNEASRVFKDTRAGAVVLMVIDGERGTGFSVLSSDRRVIRNLPDLLKSVASEIEPEVMRSEFDPVEEDG